MTDVLLAKRIATDAHAGQTDKSGHPYIHHPERVAARLHSADERAVAWLHDVIEDTTVTSDDLRDAGVNPDVIEAVEAITHRHGEPRTDYLTRVVANPLATRVKRADVADNTAPQRTAQLDPATRRRLESKYAQTVAFLDAS